MSSLDVDFSLAATVSRPIEISQALRSGESLELPNTSRPGSDFNFPLALSSGTLKVETLPSRDAKRG